MKSRAVALPLGVASYFLSSLGGIAIVKFLNYKCCFTSWILIALVSMSSWVLSFPLNLALERRENVRLHVSWKQLRLYLVLSIGLSVVELLNSLSMSALPGSWYALLKSSNIGFSMILSCCILGKSYHWGQILGSCLVMGGVGVVFVLSSKSPVTSIDTPSVSLTLACLIALAGAFLNAVCNVITEATLKETHQTEVGRRLDSMDSCLTPPSKLLLSNSFSAWTSLFSFLLLALPTILFGKESATKLADLSCVVLVSDQRFGLILSLSLVLLAISRLGERLSKHWICAADSAVTFSVVAALRRISGVFILAALFHESFPRSMIVGSCTSAVGFFLHFWYEKPYGFAVDSMDDKHHHYELVGTAASEIAFKEDVARLVDHSHEQIYDE
jgi:CRT-like, chloroquine-resistance transporter-like